MGGGLKDQVPDVMSVRGDALTLSDLMAFSEDNGHWGWLEKLTLQFGDYHPPQATTRFC